MELIIRSVWSGARIRSEPTAIRPRRSGRSKVQDGRTVWANLQQVMALRRLMGPRPGP